MEDLAALVLKPPSSPPPTVPHPPQIVHPQPQAAPTSNFTTSPPRQLLSELNTANHSARPESRTGSDAGLRVKQGSPHPGSRSRPTSRMAKVKPKTPRPVTPLPSSGQVVAGGDGGMMAQAAQDAGRPLDVTDALTYLDNVKMKFQDKPDVYNHFLDIMKDFKSQVIDTPGVIDRVSVLFNGNPDLIQGFNTFLPPGYRIECSTDPHQPNIIMVTTPSGTTAQSTSSMLLRNLGPLPHSSDFLAAPSHASRSTTPLNQPHAPVPFRPGPFSPSLHATSSAASFLGNLNNRHSSDKQSPAGEINHAIQYINKIKTRYADDPNTYKQFLEILQTYQKEQRHWHESRVFAQVQMLFKDAPDLLAEFKDFLPDPSSQSGSAMGPINILPNPIPNPGISMSGTFDTNMSNLSDKADKSPRKKSDVSAPAKRRKKAAEKEPPAHSKTGSSSRSKKPKHHHKPEPESPTFSAYNGPPSPRNHAHVHPILQPQPHTSSSHPHQHTAHSSIPGVHSSNPSEELMFFDRAKKALETRDTYDEFLRLLNLFANDIIDANTLMERAQEFLGTGDLLTQFKELMAWDDNRIEHGPIGSIRTGPPEAVAAQPLGIGEGPSYRRLPESESKLACSGRDELCRSVLNDDWVSHPTWASEEAGFVSHKKNVFEEALHRSEEERHEYQVHIDWMSRTIAVLEPLCARIDEMSTEERTSWRLKPDFGGSSKSIYHRLIKKVYGRDAGLEILQALQDSPAVAVPVVLARLKAKNDEWRRVQREWNRTWREIDAKNFYKSLDHQGISFKANDKKNITAKHFVGDIETVKAEQTQARLQSGGPLSFRGSVGFQLEYSFEDTAVLHDSLKLIYSYLDHSHGQYSLRERRGVERFLRSFVPLLCMYPVAEFNAACGPLDTAHDDDMSDDLAGLVDEADEGTRSQQRSGRRSAAGGGQHQQGGVAANDLRKKLFKTAQLDRSARESPSVPGSRSTSPTREDTTPLSVPSRASVHEDVPAPTSAASQESDVWITEASTVVDGQVPGEGTTTPRRPFFTNTTFYTLLRLLQVLYSRLLLCKEIGAKVAAEHNVPLLPNPIAVELGLDDPNGPSAILAQAAVRQQEPNSHTLDAAMADATQNVGYMYLLDACEKVFDNELDQATFEEHMRWFFGTKAFNVFTLDKVIAALIKQVQTVFTDHKCQELWALLQKARATDLTAQDKVRYRREAEQHVGSDDNLYRIEWSPEKKTIRLQLVGAEDPSVDEDRSAKGRWREYVDTFITRHPTEWMPSSAVPAGARSPVFLRRCLIAEDVPRVATENGTAIQISLGTYKIFYEAGTEDVLVARRTQEEYEVLQMRAVARKEEQKKCEVFVT